MTKTFNPPRKLIEVALPLEEINRASSREKSIRHGHPSTLHMWWARRPLAAARAVLFAQLVNDPSWKYTPEELKKPQVRSAVTRKRNELFRLIAEFVQWENSANASVLSRAREAIAESWKDTCAAYAASESGDQSLFNPKQLPGFLDPFAGGGAIPLEAQRLGLNVEARDLNPVAVLLNRAMTEIPPAFKGQAPLAPAKLAGRQAKVQGADDWSGARGLAEDVRRYGSWVRNRVVERLSELYPAVKITKEVASQRAELRTLVGKEVPVIAWLWARTVRSPNPAARGSHVPLISATEVSTGRSASRWVVLIKDRAARDGYRFDIQYGGVAPKLTETVNRRGAVCALTETAIPFKYIRDEGKAGRLGQRLMAIVVDTPNGRVYLPPSEKAEATALSAQPGRVPDGNISHWPGRTNVVEYGLTRFAQLYTARQQCLLVALGDSVKEAHEVIRADASKAGMPRDRAESYASAVCTYLGLGASKVADYCSSLVTWSSSRDQARNTFGRQALPMVWDFAEVNPFADAAGDFGVSISGIAKALEQFPASGNGKSRQADAQELESEPARVISTDPPYFDNIEYADLSDYFYLWLRRALGAIQPDLFGTLLTPKDEELVANPYRHGGKEEAEQFFLAGMSRALKAIKAAGHPAFPVALYYAFKQSDTEEDTGTASTGWETFLEAVIGAGLCVVGTWPMRTERASRNISIDSNALASSIILAVRPRPSAAPTVSRRDFLRTLHAQMPRALAEMVEGHGTVGAIAPVDLAQASIGPGMAVFSQYGAVLEADGSRMTVKNALIHINRAIDEYFAEAEGELDPETRFCIGWFQQYGFDSGPFGEADVLARAKGTAVNGVAESGVAESGRGRVRLLKVKELARDWDPTRDDRVPVWEACHQLCRALRESEGEAGKLLAGMPEKQEAIRQLSYRLYTLCERKGWAEEARAYNELIASWPAIVEASARAGVRGEQLGLV